MIGLCFSIAWLTTSAGREAWWVPTVLATASGASLYQAVRMLQRSLKRGQIAPEHPSRRQAWAVLGAFAFVVLVLIVLAQS